MKYVQDKLHNSPTTDEGTGCKIDANRFEELVLSRIFLSYICRQPYPQENRE